MRHAILLESTTAGAIIDCFLLFVCVVFLPEFLYVFQPLLNVDIYDIYITLEIEKDMTGIELYSCAL